MITDSHIEFARELVALARKHGVNSLTTEFHPGGQRVRIDWAQGRHGARNQITISTNAARDVPEVAEPVKPA